MGLATSALHQGSFPNESIQNIDGRHSHTYVIAFIMAKDFLFSNLEENPPPEIMESEVN